VVNAPSPTGAPGAFTGCCLGVSFACPLRCLSPRGDQLLVSPPKAKGPLIFHRHQETEASVRLSCLRHPLRRPSVLSLSFPLCLKLVHLAVVVLHKLHGELVSANFGCACNPCRPLAVSTTVGTESSCAAAESTSAAVDLNFVAAGPNCRTRQDEQQQGKQTPLEASLALAWRGEATRRTRLGERQQRYQARPLHLVARRFLD
jgi:hypothetical protein